MNNIKQIGFIDKGTGKHQSNIVYDVGAGSNTDCINGDQILDHDSKFSACSEFSYCIDANYFKGISFEQFLKKHRRQLIIEKVK